MSGDSETRPGGNRAGQEVAWAATAILPDAAADGTDPRPRCVLCGLPLTAPRSLAHGFGPVCWTRIATAQRRERAEAIRARLWGLLRRLPDLDVQGLAVLSAALDDAVDALEVTA